MLTALCEPLNEREGGVGDFTPAVVDRECMSAVGELEEQGLVPALLLVGDPGQDGRNGSPDAERLFAKRMGATTTEVPTNHVAMVSHPDDVVRAPRWYEVLAGAFRLCSTGYASSTRGSSRTSREAAAVRDASESRPGI
jgi:hypothetical protein